ncbi:thioredoxin H-type-like [Curcuma longa]|uniref:thioredoxin H-type-like n=1 Tax=Curcuma longa TaxID=136217 RepID=UPI003D9E7DFD
MAEGVVIECKSKDELDQQIQSKKLVVVDFTATWCGPCKVIAPHFAKLAEQFTNIIFLKVDVDESTDLSQEWAIRGIPTFIFIKEGKEVERLAGANPGELTRKVELLAAI